MNSELIQRMRDAADTIDDADKLVPMEYGYWNSTQLREFADEWEDLVKEKANPNSRLAANRHPELIGLQETAEYCGVSYRTVRRWIAEGRLDAVRVGPRLIKVSAVDLDSFFRPTGGAA